MSDKQTFTEAQRRLIEKHSEINVHDDWYESTIESFVELLNSATKFDAQTDRVQFSGFWSQGDGASFTFSSYSLATMVDAATDWLKKQETEGPDWGADDPTYKVVKKTAEWLRDTFEPLRLCGQQVWDDVLGSVAIKALRTSHHYSHARTVTASWDVDDLRGDSEDTAIRIGLIGRGGQMVGQESALLDDDEVDGMVEDLANALYDLLRTEYDGLTSDESVWDTIVANGLDEEDEEDEETEDGD